MPINLCCFKDHDYHNRRRRASKRQSRDLPFVKFLNISVTLSPYLSVDSQMFQASIQDRTQDYWLSLPTGPQAQLVCFSVLQVSDILTNPLSLLDAIYPLPVSHCLCPSIGSSFNTVERKILCQVEHH